MRARGHSPTVGATLGRRWTDDSFLFISVAGLVLLSRIPFLGHGYGTQDDAWRVALAAHSIATTGQYSASRFPGYPVQEFVCSLLWSGGPWALNGMTALLTSIGTGFFALSMKALDCKDNMIASLALAFVPIVYTTSTMSLDNLWALAFILSSLYFVLLRRPLAAGVLLGIAIGCRITSGAMLVPLGVVMSKGQISRDTLRNICAFCVAAGLVGAAAFAPVVATYGWGFFTFYERWHPSWRDVVHQATLDVWGTLGLGALLVGTVSLARNSTGFRAIRFKPLSDAGLQFIAWILAIVLYTIAYLRLPHQPRYLIPMLPFVILVLNRILDRRVFVFVCSILIASSFLSIGRTGVHPGPIFSDHAARRRALEFVERVIPHANALQGKAVIVAGPWLYMIWGVLLKQPHGVAEYVDVLDASDLQRRLGQGWAVYYLPEMRNYNRAVTGIDLAISGAEPLLALKITDFGVE